MPPNIPADLRRLVAALSPVVLGTPVNNGVLLNHTTPKNLAEQPGSCFLALLAAQPHHDWAKFRDTTAASSSTRE
jgi:hypothetical protein